MRHDNEWTLGGRIRNIMRWSSLRQKDVWPWMNELASSALLLFVWTEFSGQDLGGLFAPRPCFRVSST